MKCKKWIKVCMVLVTISVFLMGCGETGDDVQGGDNSKTQYEAKKGETKGLKNSKNSLFKGTIFDYLIFGETTLADIEQLLDDRVLEYKHGYSSTSYLNGKTKITDEFYGSRAIYNYEFTDVKSKDELVLQGFTVLMLLENDLEYRNAVKNIRSAVDECLLKDYESFTITDSYSDWEGEIVYYPVQKIKINQTDYINCVVLTKFPNCNKDELAWSVDCDIEDVKHYISVKVGATTEQEYIYQSTRANQNELTSGPQRPEEWEEWD